MCVLSLILWDPVDCSPTGSFVHGIFQQKYCIGLPFLSLQGLPDPGIKPLSLGSPALQANSFTIALLGKPHFEAIYIFQSTVIYIYSPLKYIG